MSQEKIFAAEIDSHIAIIDLHKSTSVVDAVDQLEKELFLVFNNGEKYCRIVHGIGTGRLADAVHAYIDKHPLIADWQESDRGGSCLVLF